MTYEQKVEWLKRYRQALAEEKVLIEEIDQLRTEAERITPRLEALPGGSGSSDKIPKAVEKITELQEKLQKQVDQSYKTRQEIVAAIETLHVGRAREILHRRYLLGQRWEKVADEMLLDCRWVRRLHHQIVGKMDLESK